jgi:uracil-DNA glycosylase family protein
MPMTHASTEPDDASPWVPASADLTELRAAAASCRGCELWRDTTQTVFGEGSSPAPMMLIGEQPGDREDLEGHPFVGPAGKILSQALDEAGIERTAVYVTNAVKHFRHEQRGKKRIHRKPSIRQVQACAPWLHEELRVVDPEVVVLLGATAARSVLGPGFSVTEQRGHLVETPLEALVTATVHPSSILRLRDHDEREVAFRAFVRDLRFAASAVTSG